jgi:hypothetical protein
MMFIVRVVGGRWRVIQLLLDGTERDLCGAVNGFVALETAAQLTYLRSL